MTEDACPPRSPPPDKEDGGGGGAEDATTMISGAIIISPSVAAATRLIGEGDGSGSRAASRSLGRQAATTSKDRALSRKEDGSCTYPAFTHL